VISSFLKSELLPVWLTPIVAKSSKNSDTSWKTVHDGLRSINMKH
jgi:hypothetical protein